MREFFLLTRDDCPLCTEAFALINEISAQAIRLHLVDIEQQPDLLEEYGWLIPVLIRAQDDQELKWPFTPSQVQEFLAA